MSIRKRLIHALSGKPVIRPAYLVYDAFLPNPGVDWELLFSLGLGEIRHRSVTKTLRPHSEVIETTKDQDGMVRRDVVIRTDIGELHEHYLGKGGGMLDWRMEHLIKKPQDYRILKRAFEDSRFILDESEFLASEAQLQDRGITLVHADRTPFQRIMIDYAGLERFSYDFADGTYELFELLEMMNHQIIEEFEEITKSEAQYIKLWENIGVDSAGPHAFRKYIVPVYEQILYMFSRTSQELIVHYDGNIRLIKDDIRRMGFQIDSLTPPPEGDMTVGEARDAWPDTFLWLHPSLSWLEESPEVVKSHITRMTKEAGGRLFCFEMSEGVPENWESSVPAVLEALDEVM